MHLHFHRRLQSQRGSVLLFSLLTIMIMTILAISALDWAQRTYRSAVRKQHIEQARIAAGNEVEFLFYQWANEVDRPSNQSVEARLQAATVDGTNVAVASANISTTAVSPFIPVTDSFGTALPLTVGRTLVTLSTTGTGKITIGGLPKTASVGYYTARVQVNLNDPIFGPINVRLGRRFAFQKVSPFNFAVFYTGDLELNPAGSMIVGGDVQCNNNIYIGSTAASGGTIKITGNVYYYDKYNGASDPTSGTQTHQYKAASLYNAPIFDRDLNAPDILTPTEARADQVKKLNERESFISNINPDSIYNDFKNQSPSPYSSANDVMRAIIAPPPTTAAGAAIQENQVVAQNRLYNKASLRIEVGDDGSGNVAARIFDQAGNNVTAQFPNVITGVRQPVMDKREGMEVAMTSIDVAQFKAAIDSSNELKSKYNGVVYAYDKSQQTDAANRYGIRLLNASAVPNFNEKGFVVASNNGVYVQGDFNTSEAVSDAAPRCAILADAITLLSQGWNDANDAAPIIDASLPDNQKRKATSSITINAALVSGNTPSVDNTSTGNSGGVQNLVRLLEDWSGQDTTINGSIGQMYTSKYFNAQFKPNGYQSNTGVIYDVYQNPANRYLNFDRRLAEKPPSGAPASVTRYYRGDLFTWVPPPDP
ncbi:hypothetical protein [Nibricoccus sp. IMCC34717]|uniref:hypothetical protein n=1 Tax=Nibricoccus sp. IMCC34717 TaxID=3034021 RepID=UPI00384CEFFF